MKCHACNVENEADAAFCEECGAALEASCSACGTAAKPGARFCRKCGTPLAALGASSAEIRTPAQTRFISPEDYTPKFLAERILTSRAALEGELKLVTVLFADIKASMELIEDRSPEEVQRILDPFVRLMMDAVHRYDGTVNQVMGDGIMALFGAPLALEDHALRACYAALHMQELAHRHAEDMRRTYGISVFIRIGINSGEVVVRSIGSDLRMDYSAVGQTTHLAARVEQIAQPGSTLMTSHTLDLVSGYVETNSLGPIALKGMSQPVVVHELLRAGQVQTRFQVATTRGLSQFVGRLPELDQMHAALLSAAEGQGRIVAVAGEPGVGKSRLFYEFMRSPALANFLVLRADSFSHGRSVSYLPVISILKSYFRIDDRDSPEEIRKAVANRLKGLDPQLEPALPLLATLLGVASADDTNLSALDPIQRRRLLPDAVRRLLFRESQIRPVLLIFENLHWLDSETQAFLDGLVDSLPGVRMLLLVNYRPEYRHGWGSRGYYTQLQVHPLSAESADVLLDSLLGLDTGMAPLKRMLIERTEGNPFFLEETVRTLIESGAIVGESHARRLAKPLSDIQVPASVQTVLAERIDRLAPDCKRLLQCAAVVGRNIPLTLLHTVADLSEENLQRELAQLQASEFLFESALFPEVEYTFKHALTQGVAYRSLLEESRRALHGRIVDAIEGSDAERRMERVEELGHHAFHGQRWDKAAHYMHQAGLRALSRSGYHEAAARFEQALAAMAHLPEDTARIRQRLDILLQLRDALLPLGEYERGREHLRTAEALAVILEDDRQLGWNACYLTNYCWLTADHEKGFESGRRALKLGESVGDFGLQIAALMRLTQVHYALGECREALGLASEILKRLDESTSREHFSLPGPASIWARTWSALSLADTGEFARAEALAKEALVLAETAEHSYSIVFGLSSLGLVRLQRGDADQVIPLFERAHHICGACSFSSATAWSAAALSSGYVAAGRTGEARQTLEAAIEHSTAKQILWHHSAAVAALASELLASNEVDTAIEQATEAVRLSQLRGERSVEAQALYVLGAAMEKSGRLAEAGDGYNQALAMAQSGLLRPLQMRCLLARGSVRRRTGHLDAAHADLTAANILCRTLGMTNLVARIEAELQALAEGRRAS